MTTIYVVQSGRPCYVRYRAELFQARSDDVALDIAQATKECKRYGLGIFELCKRDGRGYKLIGTEKGLEPQAAQPLAN